MSHGLRPRCDAVNKNVHVDLAPAPSSDSRSVTSEPHGALIAPCDPVGLINCFAAKGMPSSSVPVDIPVRSFGHGGVAMAMMQKASTYLVKLFCCSLT